MKLNIKIPPKLVPIMNSDCRFIVLYGGRGGAKTTAVCEKLIIYALQAYFANVPKKILCTREFLSSIKTSTMADLKNIINRYNLNKYFIIKRDEILTNNLDPYKRTEFLFKGLSRDIENIKSIPDIDICFVEEAETVKLSSWEVLIPTIRKENSQIFMCFNPISQESTTYKMFVKAPPRTKEIITKDNEKKTVLNELRININYNDNPFLSQTMIDEIEYMRKNDYAKYEHIYLGKILETTEDVIFKDRFKVEELDIKYDEFNQFYYVANQRYNVYYGLDFGFSQDPSAFVEILEIDKNTIYINKEIYINKLLITNYMEHIIKYFGGKCIKKEWFGDCSRPDLIAQLQQAGLNIKPAKKHKNSVKDGIEWLKGKNIIINPTCSNTIYEFYNYKYKKDKNTGNITTDIIDENNHIIDAIRYALSEKIEAKKNIKYNDRYSREFLEGMGMYG